MAVTVRDRGSRGSWWRAALVALAALVLAGTVVALVRTGGSRGEDDASTSALDSAQGAGEAAPADGMALEGDDAAQGAGSTASLASVGAPRIIRTAALRLEVKGDVADAVEQAEGVAATAGGFVASSSTSTHDGDRSSAELTLRVPADRFDDVRRRLEELGTVRSSETGGEDVGGQLVDLAARLRTLRAEEGALEAILGRASAIGEVLEVRDRLTDVRTQIEQLAGQQASLEDRVGYATISVSFHHSGAAETLAAGDDDDTGLLDSVATAVDATEAVVGGMVIVLGAALPFLVLAALGWPVVRVVRRRLAAS